MRNKDITAEVLAAVEASLAQFADETYSYDLSPDALRAERDFLVQVAARAVSRAMAVEELRRK